MATVSSVFKVAQNSFFYKTSNQNTGEMALFLVVKESAAAKIAWSTYLKLTLSGNFVGWA